MQHALCKNMAALKISAKLHFIKGEERYFNIWWHRLHGADPKAGSGRHDFFLAGDQGHLLIPGAQAHPVINFARQQPQRQADHAFAMSQHTLNSVVGFTSIGGAQNGSDGAKAGHGG